MKNILKIILNDFKHIITNVVAVVVIIGLTVLPPLYAWFNINSNWDPYSEKATSNLKIAVYSNDEGISLKSLKVNIGDSIIEALGSNNVIGWEFPKDERTAINGVYDGKYYAALVIPADFTKNIAGVIDGNLDGGKITYYENEKKNAIGTIITSKAKNTVENQVNSTVFSTLTEVVCKIGDTLENVTDKGSLLTKKAQQLDSLKTDIQQYIDMLDSLENATQSAKSSMQSLSSLSTKMITDLQKDLSLITTGPVAVNGLQTASIRLEDYVDVIDEGTNSIKRTKKLLTDLKESVSKVQKDLIGTENSEAFQSMISVLENEPEKVGEYFSSLVDLDKVEIYKIGNYGSAMAPFYTVLAIWVGALILVAIIHTKVKPVPGIQNIKVYQEFFGRYALFFIVGQLQTLLCVLGDIFFLEIQCEHPFWFWFASAVSSCVFTMFIYALTFAFGNVGEAVAVIIMVIQVAGAGGTFPKEVLPQIYQNIFKFLPFPYCMTALRECVGGFYKNDYWIAIGKLLLFILVSLAIGLLLKKPFAGLNRMIEKSKEKSDIMV